MKHGNIEGQGDIKSKENYQTIASNSEQSNVLIQSGWTFVSFAGASYAETIAITFPIEFTSILGVEAFFIGGKTDGDPTVITDGVLGTANFGMVALCSQEDVPK